MPLVPSRHYTRAQWLGTLNSMWAFVRTRMHLPDSAPTPRPATKRPIVICANENVVPVWIAVPAVKMADQSRMEPRRPHRSAVNACPRAPTKVLRAQWSKQRWARSQRPTYPAERSEVMIDCRAAERVGVPLASTVPKRRSKSGMIRQPCMVQ